MGAIVSVETASVVGTRVADPTGDGPDPDPTSGKNPGLERQAKSDPDLTLEKEADLVPITYQINLNN